MNGNRDEAATQLNWLKMGGILKRSLGMVATEGPENLPTIVARTRLPLDGMISLDDKRVDVVQVKR
jgi:hypothetical protein